jgi:hypothetical protein
MTLSPQREALEAAEAAAKAKGKEGDAASGSGWLRYVDTRAVNIFNLSFAFHHTKNPNSNQGWSETLCFQRKLWDSILAPLLPFVSLVRKTVVAAAETTVDAVRGIVS